MAAELHALVLDGQYVESRMVDPADVPQHKLGADGGKLLRPFIDAACPPYEPTLEVATAELVVTPEQVEKVWTVTRLPLPAQIEAVKTECGRRIYTPFPQWKQANLTARATELVNLKIVNGSLSPEEAAEFAALQDVWDWIKSVRAASDALEAMDPIPLDYCANTHWPAEWGV